MINAPVPLQKKGMGEGMCCSAANNLAALATPLGASMTYVDTHTYKS